MRLRRSFNPKRRIKAASPDRSALEELADQVRYGGNPEHKRHPGDFGLTPAVGWRPGKSLCDGAGIVTRGAALTLLREGLRRGLVSERHRGEWPQNVWAVTDDGIVVEAQWEAEGVYHGYPMPLADPLYQDVLLRWSP